MKTINYTLQVIFVYAAAVVAVAGSMGLLAFLLARLFTLGLGCAPGTCGPNDFISFFQ